MNSLTSKSGRIEPASASLRILHLEDSVNDAFLVEHLLTETWPRCQVQRVDSRGEYRNALESGNFDVILSDYSLPDFDGLSALDFARARWPDKPFIFLSGTIGEERAIEALKRGAYDYIIKDRPGRLIPAIRQALAVLNETEQRHQAEEALHQNRERFRQITENVADLIAVLDLEGHRVYHNPAYGEILGEDTGEQPTDSLAEIHPEDRERVREIFHETIRTGLGQRAEYRFLLRDGSVRHIESLGSVVRDAAGQVVNLLVVSRDVTARREADKRIREQAALLDKARDAIVGDRSGTPHCVLECERRAPLRLDGGGGLWTQARRFESRVRSRAFCHGPDAAVRHRRVAGRFSPADQNWRGGAGRKHLEPGAGRPRGAALDSLHRHGCHGKEKARGSAPAHATAGKHRHAREWRGARPEQCADADFNGGRSAPHATARRNRPADAWKCGSQRATRRLAGAAAHDVCAGRRGPAHRGAD